MKKQLRYSLAAAAASFAICANAAPLPDSSPRAQADASIAKGLEWLAKNQKEDGSFSNPKFPALTGLALWAMAGANDAQYSNNVDKAVAFLVGCAKPDGGIYNDVPENKGGGLATYNTAICLTALHAAGRDESIPVMLKAREFLASAQEAQDSLFAGGFGYDRNNKRNYADLMNTHFVLDAMRRTESVEDLRPAGGKRADIAWDAALAFVEKLQNDANSGTNNAGGFFYTHNDAKAGSETISDGDGGHVVLRSYGSITYAGLMSMLHCKLTKEDPRVASAIDWAGKHWTLEENPGMGQQGLFFFYNVMSRAMSVTKLDEIPKTDGTASIKWSDELIGKITSLMNEDGSWTNANARFWENDPVLSTAYSIIALEFAAGIAR